MEKWIVYVFYDLINNKSAIKDIGYLTIKLTANNLKIS